VENSISSENKAVRWASRISLFFGVLILGIKFYAYAKTESQAIFSDALESIVNVVAALLALVVIRVSSRPADRKHPYGHGKIEYFSAAFEGGLIAFAACFIIFESAQHLMNATIPQALGLGMFLSLGTGIMNLLLGIYLRHIGKKHKSAAIEASGEHVISDFITSLGVFAGLWLVQLTGWRWVDPALGMLMGALLGYTGYRLVRRSAGGLLDEEDIEILESILKSVETERDPGLIQIHHCRVLRAGKYHHIDAHAVIPEFWDISVAHDHIQAFETRLIQKYPFEGELHLHVDPCRRAYCQVCEVSDCPIRKSPFKARPALSIEELTNPEEPAFFR
jgi:cation diffusion facilitator family transporter